MNFKRIRDLREDNDLTQKEIGKILNVAQRTYSSYENGVRNIPVQCVITLAKFYNTSTDYLLGLTDISKPYPPKK